MNFVGIDPSLSATTVCCIVDSVHAISCHTFSSVPHAPGLHNRLSRFLTLRDRVAIFVSRFKPAIVVIEGYGYNAKNATGLIEIIEYGTLLRHALCQVCSLVVEIPPSTLKKFGTPEIKKSKGEKRDPKTLLISTITHMFGHQFTSNDEYDAFAAAWFGMAYLGQYKTTTRQLETVTTVKNLSTFGVQKKKSRKRKTQELIS